MKPYIITSKGFLALSFFFISNTCSAQSSFGGSNLFLGTLVIFGLILLAGAIVSLSDNFLQIEAKKLGVDTMEENYSVFPKIKDLFAKAKPSYIKNQKLHRLDKGYDIKLVGSAAESIDVAKAQRFSMKPNNFRGLSPIPKVDFVVGEEVLAGDILFYDKKNTEVKYVAPVSGEIVEIKRAAKRSISDVVILADKEIKYKKFDPPSISKASRKEIVDFMAEAGAWVLINQRPFDVVPDLDVVPTNIFISTFQSAPLAPDSNFIVRNQREAFQSGINVLAKLTSGDVHLGLCANAEHAPSPVFTNAENAKKHWFQGKHPAGNVGVQIHHIAPIRAADKVWTLGIQEVITIGKLFSDGMYDASRKVALTGAELMSPKYVQTYMGANIGEILANNLKEGNNRIIDGDVLSGIQVNIDSFLGFNSDQITAIAEGDNYELFGWLMPLTPRPSISKSYPNFLFKNHEFETDTNTHGEKRAFVVTGQYESVMPMDIYPQHLMKAIMAGDYERMEGLGINELTEEDIALCEFVCTSKMPLQDILRDGLEMMREQA